MPCALGPSRTLLAVVVLNVVVALPAGHVFCYYVLGQVHAQMGFEATSPRVLKFVVILKPSFMIVCQLLYKTRLHDSLSAPV